MASVNLVPTIDEQPDQANTPSTLVQNLELTGLSILNGQLPDTANVLAPFGPMPYDPSNPNYQGLPWPGFNVTVQLGRQQTQNNSTALLFLLFLLWLFFH